jgi:hypothetical protein
MGKLYLIYPHMHVSLAIEDDLFMNFASILVTK